MFDGLSAMDGVFIVGALLLGFGVVKFMLAQVEPPPSPSPDRHETPDERLPALNEGLNAGVGPQGSAPVSAPVSAQQGQPPSAMTPNQRDEAPRKP